jgi:hypothetical protein
VATLIHIPTALPSPEFEVLLSCAQESIDLGNETIIVTCNGNSYKSNHLACSFNIIGNIQICNICKHNFKSGIKELNGNYTLLNFQPLKNSIEEFSSVKNRDELKKIFSDNYDIGAAAYSSYLSISRDLYLESRSSKGILEKLLNTSYAIKSFYENLSVKFDEVIIYNGRQNQTRPVLRYANKYNIPLRIMEIKNQSAKSVFTFENQLPHNIQKFSEKVNNYYKKNKLNNNISTYYDTLRSGGHINNPAGYVKGQVSGLLPLGWNEKFHNIVIFNSSEDEFAALGGEYDACLYSSQLEAMSDILHNFRENKDIVFWLRMHPNLKNVKWSFVRQLKNLDKKYDNVRVISPEDKVSSYALMDAANKVVTFGSTIGLEATYSNKPSILIGRSLYENFGSTYNPRNKTELFSLLANLELSPLAKKGAFMYADFWLNAGKSIKYFTGTHANGFKFNNKKFRKNFHQKIIFKTVKLFEYLYIRV